MPQIAEILKDKFISYKDPDNFQWFAGRFAEVYKPDIFENINYFSGMNERSQTRSGQPDSWKLYKDGIACVEATVQDAQSLKSKIKGDIDNVKIEMEKANRKATYFLYVTSTFCDRVPSDCAPLEKELKEYAIKELELDGNNIEFIFGYTLLSILMDKPKYQPLLSKFFDIRSKYGPLHNISDDIRFKIQSYQFPDLIKFENDEVRVSLKFASRCMKILDKDLRLLLMGKSGSGKTALSFIFAFQYSKLNYDCLYIDLKEQNDFNLKQLIRFVKDYGHQRQVLIIDNAQHCPALITDYHEFRDAQNINGFKSIFITSIFPNDKSTSFEPNFKDVFLSDEGNSINVLPSSDTLRSIISIFSKEPPKTSIEDKDLLGLFNRYGNDLYLFAFALRNFDINTLIESKLELSSVAFGEAVFSRFISASVNVDNGIDNLIVLACFSSLDFPAPRNAFISENSMVPLFKTEMKIGYVRKTSDGSYVLTHSAIGFAIICEYCRRENINMITLLHKNLVRAPQMISTITDAIFEQERIPVNSLVAALYSDTQFLNNAFKINSLLSSRQIALIGKFINGFASQYNKIIRADTKAFAKALSASDLISLINFLFKIFKDDLNEFTLLIPALISNVDSILKQVGQTAPHTMKDVLHRLNKLSSHKTTPPSTKDSIINLRLLILEYVCETKGSNRFFSLCTKSKYSLGYLKSFLDYISNEKPQFVNLVFDELLNYNNFNRLIERGFSSPLENFSNFLKYAQEVKGFQPTRLIPFLSEKASVAIVEDKFYNSPFDMTFPFLLYWYNIDTEEAKTYSELLLRKIFNSANNDRLISKIKTSTLPHICNFFNYIEKLDAKGAVELNRIIDRDSVQSIRNSSRKITSAQFGAFTNKLKNYGGIAEQLAQKLEEMNRGRLKNKTKDINYRSVDELLSHLNGLKKKNINNTDEFKIEFNKLKTNGTFQKSLSYLLERSGQRPYATSHRIGQCHFNKIWKLLLTIQNVDDDFLQNLLSNVNNSANSFLNEPIDHIHKFLTNLDNSGHNLLIASGVQIRSNLVSSNYVDKFTLHCLDAGVSYMSNFFWNNFKEHREFILAIVHQIENNHFKKLLVSCANSKPSELVAFFKFVDLRRKNEVWLSGGIILHELFTTYIKEFKTSIKTSKPEQNAGMKKFIEQHYVRFLKDFVSILGEMN